MGNFDDTDDPGSTLAIDNSDPVNPTPNCCTKCTGDHTNNVFWRTGAPGFPGKCILDELDFAQLFLVLERYPGAKKDLLRITDDPVLIQLANETKPAGTELEDDQKAADMINKGRGKGPGTLPYYTIMHGNTDGSITGRRSK